MHHADIGAGHVNAYISQQIAEIRFVEVATIKPRFSAADDFRDFREGGAVGRHLALDDGVWRQLVGVYGQQLAVIGLDRARSRIERQLQVTKVGGLAEGLHDQGAGIGIDHGLPGPGIGMAAKQNVDAFDRARERDVLVDVTRKPRVSLGIRLHRCSMALVGQ